MITKKRRGYELLGVSADSQKANLIVKNLRMNFPFPLLADEDHTISNFWRDEPTKQFMGRKYDGIHRMYFCY